MFLGVFCLFPLITTPFLLVPIIYRFKYSKYYLLLFILGISLVALRYIPFPTDDGAYHFENAFIFSRYDNVCEWFSNLMNQDILTIRYKYNEFPLFGLILYLFSHTGKYTLISFLVAFSTYYCYAYIINNLYVKNVFPRLLFLISMIAILLLNNFRYTTSGMRYCLAVAILTLLIYLDSSRGFKFDKFLMLYLIPFLIHPAVGIYLGLRLIFVLLKKVTLLKSCIAATIYPLILWGLPIILSGISGLYSDLILSKIMVYQNNESYEELFNTTLVTRIYIGVFVSVVYVILYYLHLHRGTNKNYYKFQTFTYYLSLISIGMAPYQNLIDRHLFLVFPMILISLLMFVIDNISHIKKQGVYYLIMSIFLGFIITGMAYNKNFLEYIHLMDYSVTKIFTSSIFDYFRNLPIYS